VPVPAYFGQWGRNAAAIGKQKRLLDFAQSEALASVPGMDAEAFRQHLAKGLVLESNIPAGYGLGSSGALCAAIYDTYCREKTTHLPTLKAHLAGMEGFFHGSSSGIDPLTSYLDCPVLIEHGSEISLPASQSWPRQEQPLIFLLDSTLPRQTGPLVQWFLAQTREADFAERLQRDLLPDHLRMVAAWLHAQPGGFWPALRQVSAFQLEHLPPMIPPTLRALWTSSLEQTDFSLKICGAGGGGFVLGFARSRAVLEPIERDYRVIFPFALPPEA
ncbi:MAG TPA: hypothetical protein PK971_00380, partial [Saprospiraceae bacterium]|nr:hypothetical protein [Saprospiraceae bacterium]